MVEVVVDGESLLLYDEIISFEGWMIMYLCHLFVVMVGMTEHTANVLKSLPLPKDGRLRIEAAATLQEAADLVDSRCSAVVLGEHIPWKTDDINHLFGENTDLVVCAPTNTIWPQEKLGRVQHIWPVPLSDELLRFYCRQLLDNLYRQRCFWNTQNCLQTVIDTMPGFVWFKDMEGHHVKVNKAFCEMVGKSMSEVLGKKHHEIWGITPEQYAEGEFVCLETDEAIAKMQQTTLFEEKVLHSRLGLRKLKTYKTPVFDENGMMIGNIGAATDVTEECANQERILQISRTDELTQLANRRYFYQYLDKHRRGPLTLCYIDLDYFKQLNDTYGHQFGDAALMMVSEVLKNVFPDDFIARLGGDEFVVAIFSVLERAEMCRILDTLCTTARNQFDLDQSFGHLSMSVGVAAAHDNKVSLDTLLQRSDDALYYVKEYCRGKYVFYEDIKDKLTPRGISEK